MPLPLPPAFPLSLPRLPLPRGSAEAGVTRRARPLLGTLVEIGAAGGAAPAAVAAAFARIESLQARMSRFEPASAIGRFNVAAVGASIEIDADTRRVLLSAWRLQAATDGAFDISLGSGAAGWALRGSQLHKREPGVRLDLGGIAKGYAVDVAIRALQSLGCEAGWVNAGGDLRAFGSAWLVLQLRDEASGGVRPWGRLRDGACATSHFAAGSRSALAGDGPGAAHHLSVTAPCCLWADALTKVAARDPTHPALARFGARAWLH